MPGAGWYAFMQAQQEKEERQNEGNAEKLPINQ